MKMCNVHFRDTDFISNLKVWIRISRVLVQCRDVEILEVITQHVGSFIRVGETIVSGLNCLFVRVLLEVDLRLPLKRLLILNDDEECPLLLSYENLFEVCFYCGRKCTKRHICLIDFDNDGYLLVDRILEDEPLVCLADFPISEETKKELHDGVMLLFPQPTLVDEFSSAKGGVHAHGDSTQEQLKEEK